jgi:hypothetical protein
MLFSTIVLAGKTEEFEQKSTALGVCRVIPQQSAKSLNGFLKVARLK